MLVRSFPAQLWGTNCHIVARRDGEHAVIIDPGYDVVDAVADVVAEHRLRPVAIMLTHGHLDHTWSILPLSGSYDAACWIHPGDRPQLADPGAWLSPGTSEMLAEMGAEFAEPEDVRDLADGVGVEVAGLRFEVDHTPGHSLGSVMFRIDDPAADQRMVFSGDTLFAGSIGRTDLPGADAGQMRRSLTAKVLPLADETVVLPGHGPNTTIAVERATNPYLRESFLLERPDSADGSRA